MYFPEILMGRKWFTLANYLVCILFLGKILWDFPHIPQISSHKLYNFGIGTVLKIFGFKLGQIDPTFCLSLSYWFSFFLFEEFSLFGLDPFLASHVYCNANQIWDLWHEFVNTYHALILLFDVILSLESLNTSTGIKTVTWLWTDRIVVP